MRFEVVNLADGWAGTDETVRRVTQLVDASLTDPLVRLTAEAIMRRANVAERDRLGESKAISRFVRHKIRYRNEGAETLKTPRLMLEEIRRYGYAQGDCDDHCILWLALHKVMGHKARFKVISQRPDGIANHIYAQVFIPGRGWITDDTIKKDKPMGWEAPAGKTTKFKHYDGGRAEARLEGFDSLPSGSASRSLSENPQTGGSSSHGFSVTQAYGFQDKAELGIIPIIIAAGLTVASIAASAVIQKRQEDQQKKAMKAGKKMQDKQIAQAEKEAKALEESMKGSPVSATVGGGAFAGLPSWAPLAAAGAAALGLVFLLPGKKKRRA